MKTFESVRKTLLTGSVWESDKIINLLREGVEPEIVNFKSSSGTDAATVRDSSSGFKFGPASERELIDVDVRLVRVTRLALSMCAQDFTVYDGIRTYKEQQQHIRNGTSKTMQSKHLEGLAVDLVPWIGGKPTWDWDGCYEIALAMDKAATQCRLDHLITWGGAWDRRLSDFGGDKPAAYAQAVEEYKRRHSGPDFIDGPHFEIAGPRQL